MQPVIRSDYSHRFTDAMIRPRLVCKCLALTAVASTLLWLLLPLLWLIAPFPPESPDAALDALRHGRTYTRTYPTEWHWPIYLSRPHGYWISSYTRPVDEDNFALDYTLKNAGRNGDTYLTIGGTTLLLEELMGSPEASSWDGLDLPSIIPGGRTINATVATANADSLLLSSWPTGDVTVLRQVIEPHPEVVELVVAAASAFDEDGPTDAYVQIRSSLTLPDLPPSEYYSANGYEPTNGGSLLVLRLNRRSFNSLTSVYPTAESWGLSKTVGFRRALLHVMAPSALWIWAWLAPTLEILAISIAWTIKWSFASLMILAIVWLCLGKPSLERILGGISQVRPAARLERAIRITQKLREEKLQNKKLRRKDLTITDAYNIWRSSREAVTGVRDFSIFYKHDDVEKGAET